MHFILKDNTRNIEDAELLENMRLCAQKIGRDLHTRQKIQLN